MVYKGMELPVVLARNRVYDGMILHVVAPPPKDVSLTDVWNPMVAVWDADDNQYITDPVALQMFWQMEGSTGIPEWQTDADTARRLGCWQEVE